MSIATRETRSGGFQFTHPRGVRYSDRKFHRQGRSFNSRTREGCDIAKFAPPPKRKFQFTHPRGVRLRQHFRISPRAGFNSRTREGCDDVFSVQTHQKKFQFTHPRGVRLGLLRIHLAAAVSIHAPARGAISGWKRPPPASRFQFTHPRGVRFNLTVLLVLDGCFNSRTREGCDY